MFIPLRPDEPGSLAAIIISIVAVPAVAVLPGWQSSGT
jgi:hypothetical protein